MREKNRMKKQKWTVEAIAQAYRDQGVAWSEDELHAKAEVVAREMRRMSIRWHHQQRKFYRNEIPCGLANTEGAYDYLAIVVQRERLRREDWTIERTANTDFPADRMVQAGLSPPLAVHTELLRRTVVTTQDKID
jgi:hypothetical protein